MNGKYLRLAVAVLLGYIGASFIDDWHILVGIILLIWGHIIAFEAGKED